MRRRGVPAEEERQNWLDQFRYEYNHLRPHEALGMKTPAMVWHPSVRHYQAHPPAWEYEPGAELRKLSSQGRLYFERHNWEISRALAGEWVQLERIEDRVLVYYCQSLVRELDLTERRSTVVNRWSFPSKCKGCTDNVL